MRTVAFALFVGTVGAVGCASIPLPADQLAQYEATIEEARAMGAFRLQADEGHRGAFGMSQSHEHLLLAADELAVAREMAGRGDSRSTLLLARAQSDVDLALALAREEKARLRLEGSAAHTGDGGGSRSMVRTEGRNR